MVEFFARTMAQDRERNIRYFNEYGMYCMFGQACGYTNRIIIFRATPRRRGAGGSRPNKYACTNGNATV